MPAFDSRFDLRDTTEGARRPGVCVGCGADFGLDVWFVFLDSRESRRPRLGVGSATLLSVPNYQSERKTKASVNAMSDDDWRGGE